MKRFLSLAFLIANFTLISCYTVREISNNANIKNHKNDLFISAEYYFKNEQYTQALKKYEEYIKQYPTGFSSDIALNNIASIYLKNGDYNAALRAYWCLIEQFPSSPYTAIARFKIMLYFFENSKYEEVLFLASKIIEFYSDNKLLSLTYILLGDVFMEMESPMDAIHFYMIAYEESDLSEKNLIMTQLEKIADQLNKKRIVDICEWSNNNYLKSYLLLRLAYKEYELKNYVEAQRLLSYIIEKFPQNENTIQANSLLEMIKKRNVFQRKVIGCLLPLSGPYEAFGNRALKAIRLAVNTFKINKNSLAFKLVVRDTQSDPEIAKRSVEELDKLGVAMIIGPMVTSEAAAKEAQKRKIPIITLTQRSGIPDLGNYVFRNFITPDMQIDALISCAIEKFGVYRFAILYPDDNYGHTFMNLFLSRVKNCGAEIATTESYQPDETDFSNSIKRLARISESEEKQILQPHRLSSASKTGYDKKIKLDFEALFIPDGPEKAGLIVPQLAYWDINDILLLGTNLWYSKRLINLGGNYLQYALLPEVFFPQSSKKIVRDFVKFYKEAYTESPGFIEALAYDTVMIVYQTATFQQVQSRVDLRDKLSNIRNFNGVTGLTSILQNGDVSKNLFLLQIDGQNFVELNRDKDGLNSSEL